MDRGGKRRSKSKNILDVTYSDEIANGERISYHIKHELSMDADSLSRRVAIELAKELDPGGGVAEVASSQT